MDETTGGLTPDEALPVDRNRLDTETTPDEIEIESARLAIEDTRANMSETVDAIKERLSPHRLVEEAKDAAKEKAHDAIAGAVETVKEKVGDAAHSASQTLAPAARAAGTTIMTTGETLVNTIRNNPLPAAMVGIGLGWLAVNAAQQARSKDNYRGYENGWETNRRPYSEFEAPDATSSRGVRDRIGHVGEKVSETASNVTGAVRETASNVAGTVREKSHDVADTVREKSHDVADAARSYTHDAVDSIERFVHDQPLAAGAVAILVCAVVGLAVPATAPEHRLLGTHRDRLLEQAGDKAQDIISKVQTVAEETIGTAKATLKSEAKEQGLVGSSSTFAA